MCNKVGLESQVGSAPPRAFITRCAMAAVHLPIRRHAREIWQAACLARPCSGHQQHPETRVNGRVESSREPIERRRLERRIRDSRVCAQAAPDQVICDPTRGLERALWRELTGGGWVRAKLNVTILGNWDRQEFHRKRARLRRMPARVSSPIFQSLAIARAACRGTHVWGVRCNTPTLRQI